MLLADLVARYGEGRDVMPPDIPLQWAPKLVAPTEDLKTLLKKYPGIEVEGMQDSIVINIPVVTKEDEYGILEKALPFEDWTWISWAIWKDQNAKKDTRVAS